ncbi:hypothetical protein Anapl_14027 [Anas platyrhynchos]|uniref:Uncharacterized protein n=1 Tax=Anas platyrhynchos TaxID=8839 RepID=R0L8D1_ANAPL|nr:hypothetical protein Anapl_14027 [Anas platyrhynchos]
MARECEVPEALLDSRVEPRKRPPLSLLHGRFYGSHAWKGLPDNLMLYGGILLRRKERHTELHEAQALHGRRSCRQTIIHSSTEDSSAHLNSQTEDKLAGQLVICSSFSRYHIIHLDTSSGHWAENCRVPETPLISYLQAPDENCRVPETSLISYLQRSGPRRNEQDECSTLLFKFSVAPQSASHAWPKAWPTLQKVLLWKFPALITSRRDNFSARLPLAKVCTAT